MYREEDLEYEYNFVDIKYRVLVFVVLEWVRCLFEG